MYYWTIWALGWLAMSGMCAYTLREETNLDALSKISKKSRMEKGLMDTGSKEYHSLAYRYVGQLNKLNIWTPIAGRERKKIVDSLTNPEPYSTVSDFLHRLDQV